MNRFAIALLAGVAGVSVMSSAFAADLIISEPAPAVGVVSTTGNWDGLYLGAFAGYGWGTVTDETGYFAPVDTEYDVDWTGSIRGRLGFDGGAFLPYVTAGVAFANATATDVALVEDTQTHIGWTVGAGVEFAVADNVSLDLQYRYTDFGSKDYDLGGSTETFGLTSHAVTAGVNFRF